MFDTTALDETIHQSKAYYKKHTRKKNILKKLIPTQMRNWHPISLPEHSRFLIIIKLKVTCGSQLFPGQIQAKWHQFPILLP